MFQGTLAFNEAKDFTIDYIQSMLLPVMCHAVKMEPHLQPLGTLQQKTANIQDGAHLNTAVNGLWGDSHERCYMYKKLKT